MKEEINIKVKEAELTGSAVWLKKQIENSEFRFSSTQDSPCIVWDFYHIVDGKREKERSKIVAFIDCGDSDYFLWEDYRDCKITNSTNKGYYEAPNIFEYLTDNAKFHCNQLIRKLADTLIEKVKSDKKNLQINVSVSEI